MCSRPELTQILYFECELDREITKHRILDLEFGQTVGPIDQSPVEDLGYGETVQRYLLYFLPAWALGPIGLRKTKNHRSRWIDSSDWFVSA